MNILIKKTVIQVIGFILLFTVASLALDKWRGKNIAFNAIPKHTYTTLNAQPYNIQQLSNNQLVVVYFWATWCGPCKVTTPSVKQLAKHYPVISIAMASGSDNELSQYLTSKNLTLPTINDNQQTIARKWGIQVTPSILFIKNAKVLGLTTGISGYPSLLARAWWLNPSP